MSGKHPSLSGIPLVLGGNVFGWTIDRDRSFEVLDAFYENGGRMIDTAEGYSVWVPGHKGGESETVIGEWLESRGVPADVEFREFEFGGFTARVRAGPEQDPEVSVERVEVRYGFTGF